MARRMRVRIKGEMATIPESERPKPSRTHSRLTKAEVLAGEAGKVANERKPFNPWGGPEAGWRRDARKTRRPNFILSWKEEADGRNPGY